MSLIPASGLRHGNGRERLLSTARALFTRHGASNVGFNDVTAAAGVAKMTLYNNFSSKEAPDAGRLRGDDCEDARGATLIAYGGKAEEERFHKLFGYFDLNAGGPDYRGCPFIHASLQAADPQDPIHSLVSTYKRALREHVLGLLEEDRGDRTELADLILLLLDDAVTEAYLKGVAQPAGVAKRAVSTLLKAA